MIKMEKVIEDTNSRKDMDPPRSGGTKGKGSKNVGKILYPVSRFPNEKKNRPSGQEEWGVLVKEQGRKKELFANYEEGGRSTLL